MSLGRTIERLARPPKRKRTLKAGIIDSREDFPRLTPPPRGAPSPIKRYPHLVSPVRWTRRDWWRFKRACYAQGERPTEIMRELMEAYTADYEAKHGSQ